MKNKFILPAIIILISVWAACKMPEVKLPKTKRRFKEVSADLKEPGSFETVNINTNSNSNNGVSTTSLELELVNGKNLPADKAELRNFALAKMKKLFAEIENKSDYQFCQVIITSEEKNGMITKTTNNSFDFTKDELLAVDIIDSDSARIIDSVTQ